MAMSLCMFGDSVGRGVVFNAIQDKYEIIKCSFVQLFSGKSGVEIKNYSAFGCTVTKGVKLMTRHSKQLEEIGGVILEFGGNDCDFDWEKVSENPELDHQPKTPRNEFVKSYRSMIDKVKSKGGLPILMTLPPIDPQRYFKRISQGLNAENIMSFLGDVGRIYRWHEYYSMAVSELAAETESPVIDVRGEFLKRKNCLDLLCEDGIHPNQEGHELISETVERYSMFLQMA